MKKIKWRKKMHEFVDNYIPKVIDVPEGRVICPQCDGATVAMASQYDTYYIASCGCCEGLGYIWERYSDKVLTKEDVFEQFRLKEIDKDKTAYDRAYKVKYADYEGKFFDNYGHVVNKNVFEEEYLETIQEAKSIDERVSKWVFGVKGIHHFKPIDLDEVMEKRYSKEIVDACYPVSAQMFTDFYDSDEILQAQELIAKWEDKYQDKLVEYAEDRAVVVDLEDLYEELVKHINETKRSPFNPTEDRIEKMMELHNED